jgi:ribosomal protein L7/L12
MPQDVLPPTVVEALESGNKVEAIKRLRGITGLGLKEAKDWIESYERGGEPAPASPFDSPSEGDRNKPIDLSEEALHALQRGDVVPAIKDIRRSTGVGLAEAKAIAEMMKEAMPAAGSVGDKVAALSRAYHRAGDAPQRPGQGLAPGQVASGGATMKWAALAVIVAAAVAAAYYFK